MSLYKEILLDYYRNPRCLGKIEKASFSANESNPLCGDEVTIYGLVDGNDIERLSFTGKGCVISLATASILLESCQAKKISDVSMMGSDDILKLINMQLGPNRLRCALLPLVALQKGLSNNCARPFQANQKSS